MSLTNNINDIIHINKIQTLVASLAYMELVTESNTNQSRLNALNRKKKIEIFNEQDTSKTETDIEKELLGSDNIITPQLHTKSVQLLKRQTTDIDIDEIVLRMKAFGDITRQNTLKKYNKNIFDIDLSLMDSNKIKGKILMAKNYIAMENRKSADFIILNKTIFNKHSLAFENIGLNIFINNSLSDEMIIGAKSSTGSSGMVYVLNEEHTDIYYSLTDCGFYPEKNFITIEIK